jgi:hypothetical protein
MMSANNAYLLWLSIDRDRSGLRDIVLQNAEVLALNDLRQARNLSALHFPATVDKTPPAGLSAPGSRPADAWSLSSGWRSGRISPSSATSFSLRAFAQTVSPSWTHASGVGVSCRNRSMSARSIRAS